MKKQSYTFQKVNNRKGEPVVVIATIGGNNGTGDVVSVTVVPRFVYDTLRSEFLGIKVHTSVRTKRYVELMEDLIDTVCGSCPLKDPKLSKAIGHAPCYVQKNAQNAGEPAGIVVNAIDSEDWEGFNSTAFNLALSIGKACGVRKFRSAVAGDMGVLTQSDAEEIIDMVDSFGFEWLGYTHQKSATWLRGTHQLSTQSTPTKPYATAHSAMRQGWSVFHVVSGAVDTIDPLLTLCFKQANENANCGGCPEPCDGKSGNNTAVINHNHGMKQRAKTLHMWN